MGSSATNERRVRPHQRDKPLRLLLASLVVLAMVIAAGTAGFALHLRQRALKHAERDEADLALVLASQAERAFEAVELIQDRILARLEYDNIQSPEAFRQVTSTSSVREELLGGDRSLPQLEAMAVTDASGDVTNSTRPSFSQTALINLTDRDFFSTLKADSQALSTISELVQARASGEWTVYIARGVRNHAKEFLGTIQGAVRLSYFEDLYRSVAPSADSVIGLYHSDGRLIASFPHIPPAVRAGTLRSDYFRTLAASGRSNIVARKSGRFDGQDRLITARAVARYPLVVSVSGTVRSILAEWREQATYLTGAAVLLELLVAGTGSLALRQLRSQRLLEEARAGMAEVEAGLLHTESQLAVAQERERADREQGVQNARFTAALSNMTQALSLFDSEDRLVISNGRHAEMFGMAPDRIVPGMTLEALLTRAESESNLSSHDIDVTRSSFKKLKAAGRRASMLRQLSDGRTLAITFAPVESEGWLVTYEDVTERQVAAARISHMAHHDALTGLPNRVLFHQRLAEAVARSRRGDPCAVLYLDLDHFKVVNDALGHPAGDLLLQQVTTRLKNQIRETDMVSRLGGDEFAILQSSVDQPQDATALATRLIEILAAPYELEGQQALIGTSIGIAVIPADGDDPDEILKNADMALYRAKGDGRDRYRFFTPEMDARIQARRALELDLRKALAAGEFELFYQPLVDLKTGAITGCEALMRWFHPRRGMVLPSDFIPLAEEIGLLQPLGRWALHRACRDAATWPGKLKVAVNVSVTQFADRTLVEDVASALAESRLDPCQLEIEITETVMLDDTEATLVILHQLRDLGIGIAMDDFGTGYSSLSYLRRFPFSKVKIDQSFVAGLGKGGDCEAIVAAVIDLCATLGMTALAEGVETEDQLERLRAGNCGEAQGYLFSRPRPSHEVAALCMNMPHWEMAARAA